MLLIIFGAGASFDHNHNYDVNAHIARLPLANQLIDDALQNSAAAKNQWPGAIPIINYLQRSQASETNAFSIEDKLFERLELNNSAMNAQLLAFKFYVYEIIRNAEHQIMSNFQGNTNYTELLARLQEKGIDIKDGISLVTFNYDTLLDKACVQLYPDWQISTFNDYVNSKYNVRLFKPHGSINWRRTVQIDHQPTGPSTVAVLSDPSSYIAYNDSITVTTHPLDINTTVANSVSEPVLALPYRKKTSFVFPDEHKQMLTSDMSEVTHILTVGWRGAEEHFWTDIMSKIPKDHKIRVLNVNTGNDEIEQNMQRELGSQIESMSTYDQGFSNFINDQSTLDDFLASLPQAKNTT